MLLVSLNETYTLTYEKAKNEYFLTMDKEDARNKVNILKRDIREIGPVNLNAPEEYFSAPQPHGHCQTRSSFHQHSCSFILMPFSGISFSKSL